LTKRKITLGTYDTAANGWTLAGWKLSDAVQKTNYVEKSGGDGSWDLSTAMTDGIPRYKDRSLTVTLECSEGDRLSREAKIRQMVNQLDGMRVDIELPDDPYRHINGRLHVVKDYNDLAHAKVTVTGVCEPWKYANAETVLTLTAAADVKTARIVNGGRRAVVPTINVAGSGASVLLTYSASSMALSAGSYQWPDLLLTPGGHDVTYVGNGTLTFTYQEADLE
jgi:hypothetical protein